MNIKKKNLLNSLIACRTNCFDSKCIYLLVLKSQESQRYLTTYFSINTHRQTKFLREHEPLSKSRTSVLLFKSEKVKEKE